MTSEQAPVPFLDLAGEFDALADEWFAAIRESGRRGQWVLGPQVGSFEEEVARYVGAQQAVAVANGTDALILALRALDIGAGDEVITPTYSFFATAEAITRVGATPVFADIDLGTYNLDPQALEALVTPRTRAILPVHLYGLPADMDAIMRVARARDLRVIEDCAQAFGARYAGRGVGAFGDAGCFSFYPTKVLGGYGDGGMITVAEEAVAERLRRLRNHGAVEPFVHGEIGYNSRLDEIQAALLRIKLRQIDRSIAGRRAVAAGYHRRLEGMSIACPSVPDPAEHVYNLYTVRVAERVRVRETLAAHGVPAPVYYPRALHRQPVYAGLGYRDGALANAERAADEVISLPVYPGMPDEHVERVCEALAAAV